MEADYKAFDFGLPRKSRCLLWSLHWPVALDREYGRPAMISTGISKPYVDFLTVPHM